MPYTPQPGKTIESELEELGFHRQNHSDGIYYFKFDNVEIQTFEGEFCMVVWGVAKYFYPQNKEHLEMFINTFKPQ